MFLTIIHTSDRTTVIPTEKAMSGEITRLVHSDPRVTYTAAGYVEALTGETVIVVEYYRVGTSGDNVFDFDMYLHD